MNWRAAIGRRAMGIVNTYFGDKRVFNEAEEIEEHVQWLLPNKDEEIDEGADEDDDDDEDDEDDESSSISIEEIVRRRKRKFVGAPFLYENGLIGPAKGAVCEVDSSFNFVRSSHPPRSLIAIGVSFKSTYPQDLRNPL